MASTRTASPLNTTRPAAPVPAMLRLRLPRCPSCGLKNGFAWIGSRNEIRYLRCKRCGAAVKAVVAWVDGLPESEELRQPYRGERPDCPPSRPA
jgi:ribosomal protein L37E